MRPHAPNIMLALLVQTGLLAASCGKTPQEEPPQLEGNGAATTPPPEVTPAGDEAVPLEAANSPPRFELPQWRKVGVGQRVGIGVNVVDPESDTIAVEAVSMPTSAAYNPTTLTFDWTPTEADKPVAFFQIQITETRRPSGETITYLHDFGVEVTDSAQPRPQARPLGPSVELLLTVHDPARLAALNEKYPFWKLLVKAAELEYQYTLPDDAKPYVKAPEIEVLYTSMLKQLADFHDNPRLDPDSPEFDAEAYGDWTKWELFSFRPRLDKQWHELRLAFRSTASPEDIITMFRFRPVGVGPNRPPEARAFNNTEFQRMIFDALFTPEGALNPAHLSDRDAHGEALVGFLDALLSFDRTDAFAEAHTHFISMPHEARLGGGSARNPDGSYASGDGWAFGAMRPRRFPPNEHMLMYATPIPGFLTAVKPSEDGTTWAKTCASRFDPHDPDHAPGYQGLCRVESGLVDLPVEAEDGYMDSGNIDSVNRYLEHKEVYAVAELALRDPRRDWHEEKAMTCSECHVRNIGVRDFTDKAAVDPSAGLPKRENPTVDPTFFVIVPQGSWYPYTLAFQQLQECKARDHFREYLGKEVDLDCPLLAP